MEKFGFRLKDYIFKVLKCGIFWLNLLFLMKIHVFGGDALGFGQKCGKRLDGSQKTIISPNLKIASWEFS